MVNGERAGSIRQADENDENTNNKKAGQAQKWAMLEAHERRHRSDQNVSYMSGADN